MTLLFRFHYKTRFWGIVCWFFFLYYVKLSELFHRNSFSKMYHSLECFLLHMLWNECRRFMMCTVVNVTVLPGVNRFSRLCWQFWNLSAKLKFRYHSHKIWMLLVPLQCFCVSLYRHCSMSMSYMMICF